MNGAITQHTDWPVFTIEYYSIAGNQGCFFVVSCAKDWQGAIQTVAAREGITAMEARCRLACATSAVSPAGAPYVDEDAGGEYGGADDIVGVHVFGLREPVFTNIDGQSGIMINVAIWAMDNDLAL